MEYSDLCNAAVSTSHLSIGMIEHHLSFGLPQAGTNLEVFSIAPSQPCSQLCGRYLYALSVHWVGADCCPG